MKCVCSGCTPCWGLCVFVIKSLHRLWVFSVVVRLESSNGCVVCLINTYITWHTAITHTLHILQHMVFCTVQCRKPYAATQHLMLLMMGVCT